jgi:hypothetical protein
MALTRGARIFATKQVMAQAGITKKEIDQMRHGEPDGLDLKGDEGPGVGGSGKVEPDGKSENPAKEIQL